MLRAKLLGLLLLFVSMPLQAGANRWTPLGLEGGILYGLAVDPSNPSTLFAATVAGAFRSTDGGTTWSKVFHAECATVAVHPTNSAIVFLVNRNREVFRSTDGGLTFALSNSGIAAGFQGSIFGRFAFQPGNPNVMYFAWPNGLFKSTDGGASWSPSDSGAVNLQVVLDLAVDSSNAQVVYLVLDSKGVYKSTNAGATWNPMNTGLPVSGANVHLQAFAQDPSSPQKLYVITSAVANHRLYASTNGGTSWTVRSAGDLGGMDSLLVIPGDGLTLFGGGRLLPSLTSMERILKSTDGGVNFVNVSASAPPGFTGEAVPFATPPGSPLTVYASLGTGLSKTVNGGTTWIPINTGLRADEANYPISFVAASPSTWYLEYAHSGIHKTIDGGASMSSLNGNLTNAGFGVVVADPANPQLLLGAGSTEESVEDDQYVRFMVRSANGGTSWSPVSDPAFPAGETDMQPWRFFTVPASPTTFFVLAPGDGVYKSTDGGLSFTAMNTGLPTATDFFLGLAAADLSGTTFYVGTTQSGLFKTTNGAANWAPANSGLPSTLVRRVAVSPAAPHRVLVNNDDSLYRSTDSGASFHPIPATLPGQVRAIAIDPVSPATIYAGGSIPAMWVYRSSDGGDTWQPVTLDGLDLITLLEINVDLDDRNRLLAGGRGGLSELTLEVSDCIENIAPIGANYSSAAGGGSVSVTAPGGCDWTASVPAGGFVSITGGTSGSGNGTVTYTLAANATGLARTMTLTIAGRAFEVTQSAAGVATFALTATASPSQVAASWGAVAGAASYEVRRSNGGGSFNLVASTGTLAHTDTTVSAGTGYLYRIHAKDAANHVIAYSNIDLAVPFVYTDPTLVAGTTAVRAAHFDELRQAATAARAAAGLSATTYTGALTLNTKIARTHLVELRSTIDSARAAIGLPPIAYVDGSITAGTTVVKRAHLVDLRVGVE